MSPMLLASAKNAQLEASMGDKDTDIQLDSPLKTPYDSTIHNVHNADLYGALRETDIPRWSKSSIHLYWAVFIAFCCSCANGYDGSLFTGILSMPYFQSTLKTGVVGSKVSLIASMYNVGTIIGAPIGAFLSDRLGRRKPIFMGASLIIIGTIIAAAGSTLATFAVGRFVLGFGISQIYVAVPAYTMEIAPPHWRGRCTGLYNIGWYGGALPAAAVTFGTNFINSNLSWRIPLILQAFPSIIAIVGSLTIPESPRFLMANGKEQEAIAFLVKYHGSGNPDSKLVQLEIVEFRESIAQDGADKRWWDYRPLLCTHSGRWRFSQAIMMSIAGQFSGNGLGYFNTVIYSKLGVTTVVAQLGYNILYTGLAAIAGLAAALLTDKMPRRPTLIIGTAASAGWLAINAGLQTAIGQANGILSASMAKGSLAAYFLFNITFQFAYTPLQAVLPAEALETTIRAKGLAAGSIFGGCMGFINQFAGPIALQNIGYKYVWFFVGWDSFETVIWYFFLVEGHGRTLEELEWVYQQPNPVKASLQYEKVTVGQDGVARDQDLG